MLSSGKSGLLPDHIRLRLNKLNKIQDLMVIISEHLTQDIKYNVYELEKYWNLKDSPYFNPSSTQTYSQSKHQEALLFISDDKSLLQGLKHHHNIFNWTHKYINLFSSNGREIVNQTCELIVIIDTELNK